MIAIVGAETPGRLDWMLQQRPAAYLLRPIRSSGVYTALVMGFHNAAEQKEFVARIDRLERRAQARRTVLAATTRLMETQGLSEPAAYRLLREAAMRQRTTIEDVSARIQAATMCGLATAKTS
jgi:AmiR/NasT family two-component response regulator